MATTKHAIGPGSWISLGAAPMAITVDGGPVQFDPLQST